MYQHKEYPKWKYAKGGGAQIVNDPEAEEALGAGWFDSPVEAEAEPKEAKPKAKKNADS